MNGTFALLRTMSQKGTIFLQNDIRSKQSHWFSFYSPATAVNLEYLRKEKIRIMLKD